MGQFLFLEDTAGLPVLDAFSEFLLQGCLDFDHTSSHPTVHLEDIVEEVRRVVESEAEAHPRAPVKRIDETQYEWPPVATSEA